MIVENLTPDTITIKLSMTRDEAKLLHSMMFCDCSIPELLSARDDIGVADERRLGELMMAIARALRA